MSKAPHASIMICERLNGPNAAPRYGANVGTAARVVRDDERPLSHARQEQHRTAHA